MQTVLQLIRCPVVFSAVFTFVPIKTSDRWPTIITGHHINDYADKRWQHIDPVALLRTQGIEAQPGPEQACNNTTNDKHYVWNIVNSRWTNMDTTTDEAHNYADITTRNIRGLFSNLTATIRSKSQISCLQEVDLH